MHERQREREEVANKAAMKSVSDKQANAESAAAKMAAAAAYEKLQKVAQEAGSLPDAEGEAMVSAAKKEYEDFVASQNEKLKAIHVQLPSKTVVHDPVDHASITFDVAQNAPTPS